MIEHTQPERPRPKRTDVGYKRPPSEHQFKPGQKPPPRKKRATKPASFTQSLIKILAEERRIVLGGKPRWITNAALLVEIAFRLAEEGNPTLSRILADYLMAGETPEAIGNEPRIEIDPEGEAGIVTYIRRIPI